MSTESTNIFHGYALDCKSGSAEKIDSVILGHKRIQKLSVQLWSVNQRTTEAEEGTLRLSFITVEEKTLIVQ
jgi:hypothetical protein